jgi:uncharacterized membrane protein YphA (DoxX/SURF4 family)
LLLRVVAGISLIVHGIDGFQADMPMRAAILDAFSIGSGALLIAGLWTPIAGSLLVIVGLWSALTQSNNPCPCVLLAANGAALALLGPGGWSIDAWLFGWKRIDIAR